MLTKFLLDFMDTDMKVLYQRANFKYYARASVLITLFLFLLTLGLQLLDSTDNGGVELDGGVVFIAVCWAIFACFLVICFCIRRLLWTQLLVAPILTIYICFALISVREEGVKTEASTFFAKGIIGTAAAFYVLVMFNDSWLVNLIVFTICMVATLVSASKRFDDELDEHWLVLIGIFLVFTYASVGYRIERLQKVGFLGKESYEKSFSRWLQIFDTFPEGMAIFREDGSLMYSNDALAKLFEYDEDIPKAAKS